jgi:hypothetical protein
MTWLSPPVFSAGAVTTAQLQILSDNLLETAAAKATTSAFAGLFVPTGIANQLAERRILDNIVDTNQNTGSTTYTDLSTTGPQVTITTGPFALVFIAAKIETTVSGESARASFSVGGASSITAIDQRGLLNQNTANYEIRVGVTALIAVTPGVNIFTMEYRVSAGTGEFGNRREIVIGL